ncbi:MAG: ComF family protein, partial [Myxococcota bacterium]
RVLCTSCVGDGRLRPAIPPQWVRGVRVLDAYDSGLGRALVRAKGSADRAVAVQLARGFGRRVRSDPDVLAVLRAATAVSWVPSPWTRRARRGFSLPALLSREIAILSPGSAVSLLRLRPGPRQATANPRERSRNLRGRMSLRRPVDSGVCVLVDDVVTTGSTVSLAARELLAGGAEAVVVLALCLAGDPDSHGIDTGVQIL